MRPSVLILDEATSSIDTRTEVKVQKAFEEAYGRKDKLYCSAPSVLPFRKRI